MKNYFVEIHPDGQITVLGLSNRFSSDFFRLHQEEVELPINKHCKDVILSEITDSPGPALQTIFSDVNPEQSDWSPERITKPESKGLLDKLLDSSKKYFDHSLSPSEL